MKLKAVCLCLGVASLFAGVAAQAAQKARLVGVVFAKDAHPGERASGSLIMYPSAVEGLDGLEVEKANIQFDASKPRKAALKGYVIDTGAQKSPASSPFAMDIPAGASSVRVTIDQNDQPVAYIDLPIISAATPPPLTCGGPDWINGSEADGSASAYRMPAQICYAGLAVIAGDFYGDSQLTSVEVGSDKARIIAESRRYCYFLVPQDARPGLVRVTLHEGSHTVSFGPRIPRLDLLQTLEDSGSGIAAAPSASNNSDASDLGAAAGAVGFGLGAVGIGGGDRRGDVEFDDEH
jgi:hypothetical protein